MSIKINITKKRQKKEKKTKSKHLIHYYYFLQNIFFIIFLLEKTPKIKSIYGKQDYQPGAKIKTSKYHTPKGMWLVIPTGVDISNQHSSQGWAYRWHCGSSAFRPDAISAPTTVPGNPSGSPRLRDT